MNKNEILKAVEYKGDNKEIKQSVTRIRDLLTAIPEDADLGAIPGIEDFRDNGAFGAYNNRDSRINSEEEKNRILCNLNSIYDGIKKWIKDHPSEAKYNILATGRKNNKIRRIIFIVILAVIAAVAITLTLLQRVAHIIPDGVQVGEIIGLVDLVLGILGFIHELRDDGKKDAHCTLVNKIANSESDCHPSTVVNPSVSGGTGNRIEQYLVQKSTNVQTQVNLIVKKEDIPYLQEWLPNLSHNLKNNYPNSSFNINTITDNDYLKTNNSNGIIICKLFSYREATKTIYIDEIVETLSKTQCEIAERLSVDGKAEKIYLNSNNYPYTLKEYFPNLQIVSFEEPKNKHPHYILGAKLFAGFENVIIERAEYVLRLENGCFSGVYAGKSVADKKRFLKEKGFNSVIYNDTDEQIIRIFE